MSEDDKLEWESILENIGDASYPLNYILKHTHVDEDRFYELIQAINQIKDICNEVYTSEFGNDLLNDDSIKSKVKKAEKLYVDKNGKVYKIYENVKE